jgi:arfaptin
MSQEKNLSIHQMLKENPANEGFQHESSSSVIVMNDMKTTTIRNIPNSLSLHNTSGAPNLDSNSPFSPLSPSSLLSNGSTKIDSIKNWGISTYKCTRQLMLEKLGKTAKTTDTELEKSISDLRLKKFFFLV